LDRVSLKGILGIPLLKYLIPTYYSVIIPHCDLCWEKDCEKI